jgi:hypothetical protein
MKPEHVTVFSFPMKSPDACRRLVTDMTAIEQLELWLDLPESTGAEHKPSVTITVKEHEWPWKSVDGLRESS